MIEVTPTYTINDTQCIGTSESFNVTVNPNFQMNDPDDVILCNGDVFEEWEVAQFNHLPLAAVITNLSKIIEPIQSRCVVFKFTKISDKEILSQLKSIAKKEKIKADENGLNAISDYTNGDLRHAINILQAAASSGNVTESIVKSIVGLTKTKDVQDVLKLALGGKISDARDKMIELIKVYGMSESDFLKYINQAVFTSKVNNLDGILETIAKYDYRILVGANPEIQLSALLAELAKIGK